MKELTPRIPAQHRTVSRILTVPRVLGTRCLSMFTSGGQLREERDSVDKVQSGFEMQENTLELFSSRVGQNWVSEACALSRKETAKCSSGEKYS